MEKIKIFCAFLLAAAVIGMGSGYNEKVDSNQFYGSEQAETHQITNNSYTYEETSSNVDQKIAESVVLITINVDIFDTVQTMGSATAFAVKYDKKENSTYMITNNHVCEADSPFMFLSYIKHDDSIPDFQIHEDRRIDILAMDPDNDLCLIKAYDEKIKPVSFKKSGKLGVMDDIFSIGAPAGVYPIWISGKFSGYIDRDSVSFGMAKEGNDFMLISGIIVGGQSGSPVYDRSGKVVGVLFATLGRYGGVATPSESIIEFLEENL